MWRCLLFLLLLTALFPTLCFGDPVALGTASPASVDVSWVFDIKMDKEDTPRGKVYLLVNGRKILIRPAVVGNYNEVEREQYKDRGIPSSAITACSGWWAGAGENLYVIRGKKQLVVYIRYLDEGTSNSSYVRLKTIQLK